MKNSRESSSLPWFPSRMKVNKISIIALGGHCKTLNVMDDKKEMTLEERLNAISVLSQAIDALSRAGYWDTDRQIVVKKLLVYVDGL